MREQEGRPAAQALRSPLEAPLRGSERRLNGAFFSGLLEKRARDVDRHPLRPAKAKRRAGPVVLLVTLAVNGTVGLGGAVSAQPSSLVTNPPASAGAWEPLAYGDAGIGTPAAWPVVYPGSDVCGPTGTGGVVLLARSGLLDWFRAQPGGAHGDAIALPTWCAFGASPCRNGNVDGEPSLDDHQRHPRVRERAPRSNLRDRIFRPIARGGAHGLGTSRPTLIGSLAPSVRDAVLGGRAAGTPAASWHAISFAGLRFAVPPSWPVSRTAYAFGCDPRDMGFPNASVTLDTDTNLARLPCPYPIPPREAHNGIQIDEGSAAAPNTVPVHGLRHGGQRPRRSTSTAATPSALLS